MNSLSVPCNLFFAIFLIALVVFGLLFLTWFSNMLRDEINDPLLFLKKSRQREKYAQRKRARIPRPFSLARAQLAFWTAIISSSYIYIMFYGHCGVPIHIDASTLAMLGISMGTTMGGVVIDKQQRRLPRHQNAPSKGFLIDILSDENGISITRFQQVIWTVIAGILYVSQLRDMTKLNAGHLPVLDTAILMLSGLSSAAYLSMKAKENTGQNSIDNDILDQNVPAVTQLPVPAKKVQPGNQVQPQ